MSRGGCRMVQHFAADARVPVGIAGRVRHHGRPPEIQLSTRPRGVVAERAYVGQHALHLSDGQLASRRKFSATAEILADRRIEAAAHGIDARALHQPLRPQHHDGPKHQHDQTAQELEPATRGCGRKMRHTDIALLRLHITRAVTRRCTHTRVADSEKPQPTACHVVGPDRPGAPAGATIDKMFEGSLTWLCAVRQRGPVLPSL